MENIQILLHQNVGAPCQAIVKEGDKVEKGTLIATPTGLGANLFSSVYGTVTEIKEDRIVIKPDEEQKDDFVPIKEGNHLDMIKEAGIVGMGGAGFPTGVKLDIDLNGGYVFINASECEPGLAHNIKEIENDPGKVIRGLKYAMEITNADKGIISVKKKNEKAVETLRQAIKDEDNITIHLLADIYPIGEERAIIRESLDIVLETTQLPSAVDSVVLNSETSSRITEAIEERKPSFSKNLTVVGNMKNGKEPYVIWDAPVGMSVGALIEEAGGMNDRIGEIIMGGPFTGKSTTVDAPITKMTGGIIPTIEFPDLKGATIGLLVCACSANEARMREIAEKMNAKANSVAVCKNAVENKPGGPLKCENPGECPGQVENTMQFKKDKSEYMIMGNCSDCSNTVMGSGPKLGLKVMHTTDLAMRSIGHPLYRHLNHSKKVAQLPKGK